MRIVSGTAKGTRLSAVASGTRPVSDRAREGLFSSLGPAVVGARVLDLYAGTGALGVEALSRGAASAVFVERDPRAVSVIRENLTRTGLLQRARVRRSDARRFLLRNANDDGPVDLVLLDPPYVTEGPELDAVLAALAAGWLAFRGWTVALTRPKRGYTPVIPVHWLLARRLEYGDTLVLVYREE